MLSWAAPFLLLLLLFCAFSIVSTNTAFAHNVKPLQIGFFSYTVGIYEKLSCQFGIGSPKEQRTPLCSHLFLTSCQVKHWLEEKHWLCSSTCSYLRGIRVRMLFHHFKGLPSLFCDCINIQMCESLHTWQEGTPLVRWWHARGVPQGEGGWLKEETNALFHLCTHVRDGEKLYPQWKNCGRAE